MAIKTPLTDVLAKELGYKDAKELRRALSDRDKGSLQQRLESGQGIREAVSGAFAEKTTDIKETFSRKGARKLGRKAYRSFFSGDNLFSAYMRGRLRKKERKELEEAGIKEGEKDLGGESSAFTKVIAKESMAIPGMARDMNVMRQNIQKLVKLWGGSPATSKEKKSIDGTSERKEDISYFAEQDKREADLEAVRAQSGDKSTTPTPDKKEEKEPGLLDSIMSMFSGGFMNAIKSIFSPKMLMKFFSKIFLPAVIIGTLFSGIIDGFKKYQETGSFSEAIISGLGGMLKFLTFGLFGEDTIRNLFDSISNFLSPITDTISEIFTGIKNFFIKLFGGQVKVEDKAPAKMAEVKPSDKSADFKSFGEGAAKAAGTSDEQSKDIGKVFGAVGTGDFGKTLSAAQEYAKKYPEQPQETTTPTPVPTARPKEEAKIVEKIDGETIKLPSGVTKDPMSGHYSYKGMIFSANDQKELNMLVDAIDQKKIIEYQSTDRNAGNVTKTFNGATGEFSLAPAKTQSASSLTPVAGDSGSAISSSGGGGGSGASPVSSEPSAPSGSEMSAASSDVSEGQRMESTADAGSVINAPTNNNSSPVTDKTRPQTVNVYNEELATMLAVT